MSHFPLVLIPSAIQQAKLARPPISSFTEARSQQPGAKPQKLNNTLIAVEVALSIIISAAVTSGGGTGLGFLSFLTAAGAIAFQTWQQITTYPQRKRHHQREVNDYSKTRENYERKKLQHEEESRISQSPERIAEFQYKLLREALSRTIPHDGSGSLSKTGASEARFSNYLERYFLDKIQTRLKVQNPSYDEGYHYTPDFAYIDRYSNLYIDIEVDEPYNRSGAPIHYVGLTKQQVRDGHFLHRGWLVIRFSEEQVVCHAQSCCKTIAQAIAQVLGDTSVLNQFANVPDLPRMRQWTQSEAEGMAARGYRGEYLPQTSQSVFTTGKVTMNVNEAMKVLFGAGDSAIAPFEVTSQVSVTPLPTYRRAQSRGAARAAKRLTASSTLFPSTTDSRPLPMLANCPYCDVKVKPTNLESHKTERCPRRPA